MLSGDCNICINGKLPSYSATCVECGLSRKNYKPITNADRIRSMTDEELAEYLYIKTCEDGFPQFTTENDWLDWLKKEAE